MNKKIIYITILFCVVIAASLFMVLESSEYYQRFYPDNSWKPLYLATLLESFLIILSILKYGGLLFRSFQNTIMFCIFIVIVSSAGFNAIYPTLESLSEENKSKKLIELYEEKRKTLDESKKVYEDKDKIKNYSAANILTIKAYDESIKIIEKQKAVDVGLVGIINIYLFVIIRVLVQLGNLICARTIGVVYRDELDKVNKPDKELYKPQSILKCVRNKSNKLYEIIKDDNVICSATTARGAWKEYKNLTKGSI